MKVNDPHLSAPATAGAARPPQTERPGQGTRPQKAQTGHQAPDDVHLSELVRSLRSLAAESPDRQAKIEQIARSYAKGTYHTDAGATAGRIVDDARKA